MMLNLKCRISTLKFEIVLHFEQLYIARLIQSEGRVVLKKD